MDRRNVQYHLQPAEYEDSVMTKLGVGLWKRAIKSVVNRWRPIVFVLTPIALLPLILVLQSKEYRAAFVVALMGVYWLTEVIPLAATALIPVLLYPLLGVASSSELCPTYMKEVMMMTLASLMLGVAMEVHDAHKRIALKMLLTIGTGPKRLLLGFLCTAAFLSMVTTNCATAAMMVPVAKAVLEELNASQGEDQLPSVNNGVNHAKPHNSSNNSALQNGMSQPESHQLDKTKDDYTSQNRPLYLGCLLAVAYGTSIGGTGTLTGAAPNLILKSYMDENYPDYGLLTFSSWTLYNLPSMLVAILATWLVLFIIYVRKSTNVENMDSSVRNIIQKKYQELGPIKTVEKTLALSFVLLMLLWFFRVPNFMKGWAELFPWSKMIGNATPAVFVALLLFVIPCSGASGSPPILDWKTAQERTPWGILLLLGGGLALAHGAKKSGLMTLVAQQLQRLQTLPTFLVVTCLSLITLVTTEILSNTSTASLFVPVIAQLAETLDLHPVFLLLPVTICCSYAFMLPMATSPNAITFQNSDMKTSEMAFPGAFLNILCCLIQVGAVYSLGSYMFDLELKLNEAFEMKGTLSTHQNTTQW